MPDGMITTGCDDASRLVTPDAAPMSSSVILACCRMIRAG
jgi:hypothetical protein